jgi:ribonucleoside-diphosphate reductase alpha chain
MGLKTTYYLRSLAASQVEKSTVDTAAFGDTHKRDFSSSAPVGNGMSVQMDSSVATQVSTQTMVATSQETLKVCSILDPDCEACQ